LTQEENKYISTTKGAQMAQKTFISYDMIHNDARRLADMLKQPGRKYDCIVAIATGGLVPARMLKKHISVPVYVVNVSHYDTQDRPTNNLNIIQWVQHDVIDGKNIILLDEVDDTRATLGFVSRKLLEDGAASLSIAVLHNKTKDKVDSIPEGVHYYAANTVGPLWICYPWEADDIAEHNAQSASQCHIASSISIQGENI
jgi:hypoxanthine phosphoribosyltransferase